jgi:polyisoprenoid-binding protein YceI
MSALATTTLPTGTYTLDAAHSRIGFVARHAMVTKVRGAFNAFDGSFEIADDLSSSWAKVSLDAASVDTRNGQRDDHIRGEDFLAVESYPTISFASTRVEGAQDGSLRLTGDLTVKGQTRPVTVDFDYTGTAVDPFGNTRVGFEGSTEISRKDWGLTWNVALEAGGLLVSDKITLEFEVSAIKG